MRLLGTMILLLFLTGCAGLFSRPDPEPPVVFRDTQVDIYQPPLPAPLQMESIRWFVITRDNIEEKMDEVERFTGVDFVLFGVTPKVYENTAWNFQETRRYIRQLEALVLYYMEVTESPAGTNPEDWLEFNRRRQEENDPN